MKHKAILFDLDGTLLDTLDDLTGSVNYVMEKRGYPPHTREEVRDFVGNGVRNLMRRALPRGEEDPDFEEALMEQITYYRAHDRLLTKPYEGVDAMLDRLRREGREVAILSNKEQVAAQGLCRHFFEGRYGLALGNAPERPRKPDPAIVEAALEQFGLSASEALYVGDSETDAKTAQNAGIDYVLVSWGFRERSLLESFSAKAVIDHPSELFDLLE